MTEEEYFRKNYPDSCYGDRLLSPYWDFFQDGVEFGERQSEKKIEELKLELTVEKDLLQEETNLHLHAEEYIKSLEQQIEKMKCCSNCKNEGDYKEPYRYGTGWCNICKRHKVAKGNFDKWEIKENE